MSDSHFEISKTMVYKFVCALTACLIALVVYIFMNTKESLAGAIKTNQESIQVSTQQFLLNDKELAVLCEKVEGHEDNESAHTK